MNAEHTIDLPEPRAQVRPLIRGAKPRQEAGITGQRFRPETVLRYVKWFAPFLIVFANIVLGYSSEQEGPVAEYTPAVFGLWIAILFEICRRRELLGTAMVLVMIDLAFVFDAGRLITHGDYLIGLYISPDSEFEALALLAMYLGFLVGGSLFVDWMLGALFSRSEMKQAPKARQLDTLLLMSMTTATFLFALRFGGWSNYAGKSDFGDSSQRNFQFEMLYRPALMATVMVLVDDWLMQLVRRTHPIRRMGTAVALLFFGSLLFMLQFRRILVTLTMFAVVRVLFTPELMNWLTKSFFRPFMVFAFLLTSSLGIQFGSHAWRRSAQAFDTDSVFERVSDTMSRVPDAFQDDDQDVRKRLDYLTTDALAVEYQPLVGNVLDLNDMFIRSVATSTPKVLFPNKLDYLVLGCEDAFYTIVPGQFDLACTTEMEGYLGGGKWGVFVVAMGAAFLCGLAEFLFRRRTVFSIIVAYCCVGGLCELESGGFFFLTTSIREIMIVALPLFLVRTVLFMALGWSNLSPFRRPKKERPRMGVFETTETATST